MCAFFLLATWYVWRIGDPMPSADNWANLDVFLRKAYYHGVGLSDFLWKRGVGDHAQPLNKALLWINARYFGLDFKLEALFAMLLGFAAMLLLRKAVLDGRDRASLAANLGIVAIAGVFFSLNSSRIYSYSMATMWFALYLGMFALAIAAWQGLKGGRLAWLPAIAFVFCVVADDVGYLAIGSIALACCLHGLRSGQWRSVARVVGCCVAGLVLSRAFYAAFQGAIGGAVQWETSPGEFLRFVLANGRDAWQWWAIPAASGLVQGSTLAALVGTDAAPWVANALGLAMLLLHAWFWWKACTRKQDLAGFMAVCIMLFHYAHVAGILYGRAPIFGTDYMRSIRYVSFYQLGPVALLLMSVAAFGDSGVRGNRREWRFAIPVAAAILLQLPIAWIAISDSARMAGYQEKKAHFLATMAFATPDAQRECMAFKELRSICASEPRRERLGGLLANNRLSVFSPQFQRRYPRLAAAASSARSDGR